MAIILKKHKILLEWKWLQLKREEGGRRNKNVIWLIKILSLQANIHDCLGNIGCVSKVAMICCAMSRLLFFFFFSEWIHYPLIWIDSHIGDATGVILAWVTKVYSEPIFGVFVEVLGSTLVDVGVRLIGEEEGLRADAKPQVKHCQKTVYRRTIH